MREAMGMINKQEWGGSESELQYGKRQFPENWKFFPSLPHSLSRLSHSLSNFFLKKPFFYIFMDFCFIFLTLYNILVGVHRDI
jgi:hypothetical protein